MPLEEYRAKRDFAQTPEPAPAAAEGHARPLFVVQEHHASHLHYDFRLEADGVLKSWAVPRGPSLDPAEKRLAVRVEDHPLGYASFEGTIPEGAYGAGEVKIWDRGTYDNLLAQEPRPQTVAEGIEAGRLEVALHGQRLEGEFTLVRMKGKGKGGKENWLLIKRNDAFACPGEAGGGRPTPKAKPAKSGKASRAAAGGKSAPEPAPRAVEVTHPERVYYPDEGFTKADVFEFYRKIAPHLLPYLRDRPCTLERYPEGIGEGARRFYQKNAPDYYPDWVPVAELPTERGKPVRYVLVNDTETLLYLVNQGTLTFHPWFSRVEDLDRPDFVLFDLDPGEATFADAVAVARQLHGVLKAEKVEAFVKTSGKTGLHILTRWEAEGGYDEARAWALGVAGRVVEGLPEAATVERSKAKRGARVYVDVMQNARGHHAVPPYVLRAVPGAPVSTPLEWREVTPELDPKAFNLKTIFRRLARKKRDPLAGLTGAAQR
jgi:bifunctional non-homologous end joining protein LigD